MRPTNSETNLILDKDREDCYFDYSVFCMNGPLNCLKYSDEVNLADEVNQAKKNKKLWVKKKKEKLLEYKNRGLKR